MINLIKSSFYKEEEIKGRLCEFIMNSPKFSMDRKCLEFEQNFSLYQGRRHSILYNSGSSANLALIQAFLNLGWLNKGDKVGVSAVTWATNVMPLLQLGIEPVPIDVSLENLNVDSENLKKTLTEHSLRAVFITNLLGFCADIDEIKKICNDNQIWLLEDNCESLGSEYRDVKLGNFGIASTFSFFVGHHMSTIEGGMVCTDNEQLKDMLIKVRAHGWSRNLTEDKRDVLRNVHKIESFFDKYAFYELGYNLRPTEITGFLGVEGLKYIREAVDKRESTFKRFNAVASMNSSFLPLRANHMNLISNFAYPLIFRSKEDFEKYKNRFSEKTEIRPVVGGTLLKQPFFKNYMKDKKLNFDCPNADKIHELGFYFPNHPEFNNEEIQTILSLLAGE